jgi:hypothetical protein
MPPAPRFTSRRTLAPQGNPPGLYRSTYDPELGAAICRRIAGGESLRSICRADPAMPTEKTVWNWARAHEEFRLMKADALGVARAASLAAQGSRDAARRATVGTKGGRGWAAGLDGYGSGVEVEILDRLVLGEGLTAICRDAHMPAVGTVYNWLRRYPEFLEDYRHIKAMAPDAMLEAACENLPWLGERKSWPLLRRTVRASDKAAARLSLKRYAPPGPAGVRAMVEEADGSWRVIYGADG